MDKYFTQITEQFLLLFFSMWKKMILINESSGDSKKRTLFSEIALYKWCAMTDNT